MKLICGIIVCLFLIACAIRGLHLIKMDIYEIVNTIRRESNGLK